MHKRLTATQLEEVLILLESENLGDVAAAYNVKVFTIQNALVAMGTCATKIRDKAQYALIETMHKENHSLKFMSDATGISYDRMRRLVKLAPQS